LHAGQASELGRLVNALGSVGALVDFLERNDIRLDRSNDGSYPREINLAIHPFAVADVVRENANLLGQLRAGKAKQSGPNSNAD
jgi:hypothetical protein